ncbi:MAG: hypothetical protein HYW81_00685 [Parcubacteria group bacterium]|nr:hypothetical protein [Parcubacteria group bacterium]
MKSRILIITLLFVAAFANPAPGRSQQDPLPPIDASSPSAVDPGIQTNEQPPLTAKLAIPLPFVPENPSLSQYIAGVYRLLIGLAALFAVVMIMVGGYQWIFSGGSSDKTGAAKKRIFGAAIGLILALLSYVILNAITPRLVAVRLPDVTPVRKENTVVKQFCKDKNNCLANKSVPSPEFNISLDKAACGFRYLVSADLQNANGECGGDVCVDGSGVCFHGKCKRAYLYGDLVAEQAVQPTPHRRSVKKIAIRTVCRNVAITSNEREISDNARTYAFLRDESQFSPGVIGNILGLALCTIGDPKGYVLEIEVNTGFLGGFNNHYLVGKDCTKSVVEFRNELPSFDDVAPSELFQKEDFEAGVRCNLDTHNFPRY